MSFPADRRLHPRVLVEGVTARVAVRGRSRRHRRVDVFDLSLDGVRWRDTEPVEVGTVVGVSLRTRRLFGTSIHLEAVIVRREDVPVAAQFLASDARALLDDYLRTLRARFDPPAAAEATPFDAAAAFRLLGIGLERAGDRPRVIVVTGARSGDGSSFVAAGSALALASMGRGVLLVDAALHAPTQHLRFAARGGPGVAQLLIEPSRASEMVQPTRAAVALLPAGAAGAGPGSFSPDAVRQLGAVVRGLGYPVVIVDAPPILTSGEALLLSRIADDTLLTVRAGVTRERDVTQALELLERNGTPATGIVLNDYRDAVAGLRVWSPAAAPAAAEAPVPARDAATLADAAPAGARSAAV